jgi:mRNA interferase MazF
VSDPAKGEIWWGEGPAGKPRPYLVLTRDEAIPVLKRIVAVPVTRSIRGIASEVPLGEAEGLPSPCVASMDNLVTIRKSMLVRRLGSVGAGRSHEVCEALCAATDC